MIIFIERKKKRKEKKCIYNFPQIFIIIFIKYIINFYKNIKLISFIFCRYVIIEIKFEQLNDVAYNKFVEVRKKSCYKKLYIYISNIGKAFVSSNTCCTNKLLLLRYDVKVCKLIYALSCWQTEFLVGIMCYINILSRITYKVAKVARKKIFPTL